LPPELSVVIPVFNESSSLVELQNELTTALERITKKYEIFYVDDGSSDDSWKIINATASSDPRVGGVRLRRNQGQSKALSVGFTQCRARTVVTLDADLQNDPGDISRLLQKLDEGYDLVCGWRQARKDSFWGKRLPSKLSNWLARKLSGLQIHDFGCTLRAYRLPVVREVSLYGELHRFLPALAAWKGFKVVEVPVNHRARSHGSSRYGVTRIVRGALDLTTVYLLDRYMSRPLHLFGVLGLLLALFGLIVGSYLVVERIFFATPLGTRPVILVPIVSLLVGLQLFMLGVLGEMMTKIAHEPRSSLQGTVIDTTQNVQRES
jgi:glycosyltransferase involved in cell wall biosynthesis